MRTPILHWNQSLHLDQLPAELLCEVYSHLTSKDIKSARLVNKKHHAHSSPYLMKRAFFATRLKTLEVFNSVVSHPVFSKSDTEIVCDASCFVEDPYYDRGEEYDDLHMGQSDTLIARADLRMLEYAAKKFTNLDSVYYTDWHNLDGSIKPWYLDKVGLCISRYGCRTISESCNVARTLSLKKALLMTQRLLESGLLITNLCIGANVLGPRSTHSSAASR